MPTVVHSRSMRTALNWFIIVNTSYVCVFSYKTRGERIGVQCGLFTGGRGGERVKKMHVKKKR